LTSAERSRLAQWVQLTADIVALTSVAFIEAIDWTT
jgi:hypothetical protein